MSFQAYLDAVRAKTGKTPDDFRKLAARLGLLQPSAGRLDVGIKLKGAAPGGRFEPAGAWNAMVTHRVRLERAAPIDAEVFDWLRRAFEAAE